MCLHFWYEYLSKKFWYEGLCILVLENFATLIKCVWLILDEDKDQGGSLETAQVKVVVSDVLSLCVRYYKCFDSF